MFNNLKRKLLVIATIMGSLSMFSIPQNVTAASSLTGDPNELLTTQLYDITSESGFYIKGEYQPSNQYSGIKSNLAAYFSEEFQLNENLKSIAGLRIEKYDQFYTGINQSGVEFNNENVLSNLDFFPSIKTGIVGLSPVPGKLIPKSAFLLSPGPFTIHPITASFNDSTPLYLFFQYTPRKKKVIKCETLKISMGP